MSLFNLTVSEKHFILPSILNDSFAGYSRLGWRSLPFLTWNTPFQPLLACKLSSVGRWGGGVLRKANPAAVLCRSIHLLTLVLARFQGLAAQEAHGLSHTCYGRTGLVTLW